jgi:CheY-like chemotaxis protein
MHQDMPKTITTDPHRIMQIMFNLLTNAVNFTETGKIRIVVSWQYTINSNPTNTFSTLSDTSPSNRALLLSTATTLPTPILGLTRMASNMSEMGESKEFDRLASFGDSLNFEQSLESPQSYFKMDLNQKKFHTGSSKLAKKLGEDGSSSDGYLKIEIFDTGCGMKENTRKNLFKKFENADASKTRNTGTGVGLWLTQNIVQQMKGSISCYSEEGEGTAFVVLLKTTCVPDVLSTPSPVLRNNFPQKRRDSNFKFAINKFRTEEKIDQATPLQSMVVDDSAYNQHIHKQFLEVCKVKVSNVANNGYEALNMYKKQCTDENGKIKDSAGLDLILMDIDMPIMNGKDACRQIREFEKENFIENPVNVVILTGYATETEKTECLSKEGDIRADYFYRKPMSFQECEQLVKLISVTRNKRSISTDTGSTSITPNGNSSTHRKLVPAFKSHSIAVTKPIRLQNLTKCILMVEGYHMTPLVLNDYMEKHNFKYLVANSSQSALDLLRKNVDEITGILIDCDGIELDGFATSRKLRAYLETVTDHPTDHIQIIGLSTLGKQYMINKGKEAGMNDVFMKPLAVEKFAKAFGFFA